MVNVNACTTAFYKPQNLAVALIEFLDATWGARYILSMWLNLYTTNLSFYHRADAFVSGCRVKTLHLGYKKTVKKCAKVNARQHRFQCDELGGMVSVADYFARSMYQNSLQNSTTPQATSAEYNITLRYPDLPLIDVGAKKQNLLPAEVCEIMENQPFRGKLTDEHTAQVNTRGSLYCLVGQVTELLDPFCR